MAEPSVFKGPLVDAVGVEPVIAPSAGLAVSAEFTTWMISEQRRIYGLCQHLLQDRDEADSATQDVFLKAHRALHKPDVEKPTDPGKWLTRIAVNTCLDRLRSRRWQFWRRRTAAEDAQEILNKTVCRSPGADDTYFAAQIRKRLTAALGRLSERQRAVFTLRHHDNLSMDEIAAILDLDCGTVKAHMHRAVSKLRVELRDLYGRHQ